MTSLTVWIPHRATISNITQGFPTIITTTDDNGYLPGLYVRIFVPYNDGVQSIVGKVYLITVISANTFSIPADTRNDKAFSLSSLQQAQVIPVAELANTLDMAQNLVGPRNP